MVTILVAEPIHEVGTQWLQAQGATLLEGWESDAWKERAEEIRAVIVRSFRVDQAVLDALPNLAVVGKYGVGVNTVDLEACAARGVQVTNVPGANAQAVAELAVTLLLAVARDLVLCDGMAREGRFRDRFGLRYMEEIDGARIGILGAGRIGRRVGAILEGGFGCTIAYLDPFASPEGVMLLPTIGELCAWADHLVIAAPLTPQSRGLVGAAELAALGPQGIVVISSRGGIVDEDALATAVRDGTIRGAGLDVYATEPPAVEGPLFSTPGIVLTPHVGGATERSRERMAVEVTRQVWALLHGQPAPLVGAEAWLGPSAGGAGATG